MTSLRGLLIHELEYMYDLVWVGETHGIANNYMIYKQLVTELAAFGFGTVCLEYHEDLEQFTTEKFMKYSHYEDGRYSRESLEFFQWLVNTGLRIICFDARNAVHSQQDCEDIMANNLLSKLVRGEKALVISGSYHGRREPVNEVTPQAGLIEKAGFKIFPIGLKYAGGQFYNFGVREQDDQYLDFDGSSLPDGAITPNTNGLVDVKYWLHVGKAVPVTKL